MECGGWPCLSGTKSDEWLRMRLRFPVCFSNRDSGMTDWFKEQKVTAHCNVREREVVVCSITSQLQAYLRCQSHNFSVDSRRREVTTPPRRLVVPGATPSTRAWLLSIYLFDQIDYHDPRRLLANYEIFYNPQIRWLATRVSTDDFCLGVLR